MNDVLSYILNSLAWSLAGLVAGFFIGRTGREVHEIREAVVQHRDDDAAYDEQMTTRRREQHQDQDLRTRRDRWYQGIPEAFANGGRISRALGVVAIVLALFTVIQGAIFVSEQRAITACQARYNTEVSNLIAQYSRYNDQDREALVEFFATYQGPTTEQERRRAFQDLVRTYERNTLRREASPLPTLSETDCLDSA